MSAKDLLFETPPKLKNSNDFDQWRNTFLVTFNDVSCLLLPHDTTKYDILTALIERKVKPLLKKSIDLAIIDVTKAAGKKKYDDLLSYEIEAEIKTIQNKLCMKLNEACL